MEQLLDASYWNNRYDQSETGWDLGKVSPPLKNYVDTLKNKEAAILIPGCGNCYEAEYLLAHSFTNITLIDIAPLLVNKLLIKFAPHKTIQVICDDFFNHDGQYDIIIEQTFFCALSPSLRTKYIDQMNSLLKPKGILAGLLFNILFEKEGPPFGGTISEYENLLVPKFDIIEMRKTDDSANRRANTELFFIAQKK